MCWFLCVSVYVFILYVLTSMYSVHVYIIHVCMYMCVCNAFTAAENAFYLTTITVLLCDQLFYRVHACTYF